MDVMFLEELQFHLLSDVYRDCSTQPSRQEVLRRCLAAKGLELIDYDSFMVIPLGAAAVRIDVYSRAFRERAERAAAR